MYAAALAHFQTLRVQPSKEQERGAGRASGNTDGCYGFSTIRIGLPSFSLSIRTASAASASGITLLTERENSIRPNSKSATRSVTSVGAEP